MSRDIRGAASWSRCTSGLRPKIAIPVHGEPYHIAEHAALARRMGVKDVLLTGDGDIIRLAPGEPDVVDALPAARLFKDGNLLIEEATPTVGERRKLSFAGIVSVAVVLDRSRPAGRRLSSSTWRVSPRSTRRARAWPS